MEQEIQQSTEPRMTHRGCAPQIRALASRYPEMSKPAIARTVGCTVDNVYSVLKRFLGKNTEKELRQFQENRADIFDAVTMRSLASITDAKLSKASAPALMMVAGTAHDKSQVLRGQATGINVNLLADVVEAWRERKADMQAQLQAQIRNRLQVIDNR